MYIQTDKPVRRLRNEYTNNEFVEFSENGVANVKEEIGEQLVKNMDPITEKET